MKTCTFSVFFSQGERKSKIRQPVKIPVKKIETLCIFTRKIHWYLISQVLYTFLIEAEPRCALRSHCISTGEFLVQYTIQSAAKISRIQIPHYFQYFQLLS